MAKQVELKERGTNETMYPVTSVECIVDNNGKNLADMVRDSLKGFYSINFTEGNTVLEFTPNKGMKILSYLTLNIETVDITAGADILKLPLANNLTIPANTLVTWEITKTSDLLPSVLGINFEYYEN